MITPLVALLRFALLPLVLLLAGCFQYDLTIQFDHQTHGQIVQTIYLSERTAALAQPALATWLTATEKAVRTLGGQVQRPDAETLQLAVPFYNGADLATKLQKLFAPEVEGTVAFPDPVALPSRIRLTQINGLVAIRNHLIFSLDLQSLPSAPLPETLALQDPDWLNLTFAVQTPWGVTRVGSESLAPGQRQGTQTIWRLQPGQLNRVDVVFWVPSWLGLGALIIGGLVLLGYFLRYRVLGKPGAG